MDAAVDRGGIDGSKFELTYRDVRATRESLTRRWREMDSNFRFRVEMTTIFEPSCFWFL
jgi:hypothetical protein